MNQLLSASLTSPERLATVLEARSFEDLNEALFDAAHCCGYLERIGGNWSAWPYGRHAEVATAFGLNDFARLLGAAWDREVELLMVAESGRLERPRG